LTKQLCVPPTSATCVWQAVPATQEGQHVRTLRQGPPVGDSIWISVGQATLECVRKSGLGQDYMFRRQGTNASETMIAESEEEVIFV